MAKSLAVVCASLALAACGLLSPASDATQDMLYGAAPAPPADAAAAARAAAGAALIDRGLKAGSPAEAQDWINRGISLMK